MHNFFTTIIFFYFLTSNTAFAQQKSRFAQQDKIWADVGLGLAENTGLVVNTALNYQRNHLIFTGQYIQTDELSFDIPVEESKEVALMAGWANRYKYFTIALQTGPKPSIGHEKRSIYQACGRFQEHIIIMSQTRIKTP